MDWVERKSKLNVRIRLRFGVTIHQQHSFTKIIKVRMDKFHWVNKWKIAINGEIVWNRVCIKFFNNDSCKLKKCWGCFITCREDEGLQVG